MPIVTIQVTGDPVTESQSRALIQKATALIEEVLHKGPEITWVIIDEVPTSHWGVGGLSYAQRVAMESEDV